MKEMFKTTENANPNYLATICRIGETYPIEGADRLLKTTVNGADIVIGNNMKKGDIVVYVPVESALSEKFLSANNLYEIGEWEKNANAPEIGIMMAKYNDLKNTGKTNEADELYKEIKSQVGYFNKRNRVRIITLRGCVSNGFIAGVNSLVNYNPDLADVNWEEMVGTSFNYIGDDEFCKKYIPPIKEIGERNTSNKGYKKRMKNLKRFDKLIEGQFSFHYDTDRLTLSNIKGLLCPNNIVTIDVKVHGTSVILSNVLTNRKLSKWEKIKKFFGAKVQETEYGNIYSSRSVIKNRYITDGKEHNSFYDVDIWGCVNRDFSPYLSKGMTVYGEIVGYLEGTQRMIQKDHDYGCKEGEWKFMPYRITETDEYGNSKEWNVSDVDAWTRNLVTEHPELADKVLNLEILYHGRLGDLYSIPEDDKWYEKFLSSIQNDVSFGMELKEPMCHLYEKEALAAKAALDKAIADGEGKKIISKLTKEYDKWENKRAPREGVVIRIDDDSKPEAFKIKCIAHLHRETLQHDNDEVDIEEIS